MTSWEQLPTTSRRFFLLGGTDLPRKPQRRSPPFRRPLNWERCSCERNPPPASPRADTNAHELRLGKKCSTDMLTRCDPSRNRKDRRSHVSEILVKPVGGKISLHRNKLLGGALGTEG